MMNMIYYPYNGLSSPMLVQGDHIPLLVKYRLGKVYRQYVLLEGKHKFQFRFKSIEQNICKRIFAIEAISPAVDIKNKQNNMQI